MPKIHVRFSCTGDATGLTSDHLHAAALSVTSSQPPFQTFVSFPDDAQIKDLLFGGPDNPDATVFYVGLHHSREDSWFNSKQYIQQALLPQIVDALKGKVDGMSVSTDGPSEISYNFSR